MNESMNRKQNQLIKHRSNLHSLDEPRLTQDTVLKGDTFSAMSNAPDSLFPDVST
jgi:hypothetical protein